MWWKGSTLVLVGLAIVSGYVFFQITRPFLLPILFAAVLAMLFRSFYLWTVARCRGYARWAAALTTFLILVAAVIPVGGALFLAGRELVVAGRELIESAEAPDSPEILARVERLKELLSDAQFQELRDAVLSGTPPTDALAGVNAAEPQRLAAELETEFSPGEMRAHFRGYALPSALDPAENPQILKWRQAAEAWLPAAYRDQAIQAVGRSAQAIFTGAYQQVRGVLGDVIGFLLGLVVMILALYYFLVEGPEILVRLKRLLPLDDRDQERLFGKFESVCRGVVLATFLSALVQAVLSGIGFAVAGVNHIWLLMGCTLLLSMIPFLGAAAVWAPVSVLLLLQERYLAGLLLAAYGAGVVSTADNLVKVYIIQGQARLHPLVVFVSILGALRIFGLWGIFVGPIVAMIFYLLLDIIREKQTVDQSSEPSSSSMLTT